MLNHKGTQVLVTERLILRPFVLADAENMYGNWASDSQVTRYVTWDPHESLFDTETILTAWCSLYNNPTVYNWAIELRETGEAIGNISVVNRSDRDEYCEIGYCLSSRYWRQGIMPEAASTVIRFLLTEVGYHRVEARHDSRNPASGRVMQKCGMIYEGTLRDRHRDKTGEFSDLCFYGITRDNLCDKGDAAHGHDH